MSINLTSAYLLARRSTVLMMFSKTVGITSTGLNGPGGSSVCGYPLPANGRALKLSVFDGSTIRNFSHTIELDEGDRISVYATYVDPTFVVSMILNDGDTILQVSGCAANSVLQATLMIQLDEE